MKICDPIPITKPPTRAPARRRTCFCREAPIVESQGRAFEVETRYLGADSAQRLEEQVARDERREGVRGEPVEVRRGDVHDRQGYDFGRVVGVQGAHLALKLVEARGGRLREQ